jgi:hypothetical protein
MGCTLLCPCMLLLCSTVEFVTSDALGDTYKRAKLSLRGLPLGLGSAVVLPGVEAAEGVARAALFVLQVRLHAPCLWLLLVLLMNANALDFLSPLLR